MNKTENKTMQDIKDYVNSLDIPDNEVYQNNSLLIMSCFSKAIEFIEKNSKVVKTNIELSEAQVNKFEEWQQSFGELPNIGATGGHFGLKVIFTSIGMVVKGISWDGKEIDLTEY